MTTGWQLDLSGDMLVEIGGLQRKLPSSRCEIQLCSLSELAAETGLFATSFYFERGSERWPVSMERTMDEGWKLEHGATGDFFSALRVEAAGGAQASLRTAFFLPNLLSDAPALSLLPSDNLLGDSGDVFALPLRFPRLAFTLGRRISSALVADIESAGTWAHGVSASYLLTGHSGGSGELRRFELLEDASGQKACATAQPAVSQVGLPFDEHSATLVLHEPRSFLPDLTAPIERLWGLLGGMPSEHASHFALLDGRDELHLERPADFLSLKFRFTGMRLVAGLRPRVEVMDKNAFITVIFPPQHVSEEAAFHSDDPSGTCSRNFEKQESGARGFSGFQDPRDEAGNTLTKSFDLNKTMQSRLAGESRLVFTLPPGQTQLELHPDALLNWNDWVPKVASTAKIVAQPPADPNSLLMETTDDQGVTSIELPWHLHLSPNDKSRWAHSLIPVSHGEPAVELWHTRLGVPPVIPATKPKPIHIDDVSAFTTTTYADRHNGELRLKNIQAERNAMIHADEATATDRTLRAIWTGSLPSPALGCHYSPGLPATVEDPFLSSLDERDRRELVHLTTDYRMPKDLCGGADVGFQLPLPVQANHLMLTSMGGYLDSLGKWNPTNYTTDKGKVQQLEVQEWAHMSTLGRDQYVRVVYKGYLLPFGHHVSLVKITERRFARRVVSNNYFATMHQRIFLVIQDTFVTFPTLGQKFGGRGIAFNKIEAVTLVTPDLVDPGTTNFPNSTSSQTRDLFWAMVTNPDPQSTTTPPGCLSVPFKFRFRFYDSDGNKPEAELPVMFAGSSVAQQQGPAVAGTSTSYNVENAVSFYNAGSNAGASTTPGGGAATDADDDRTTADFRDQRAALAAATSPGDTQYLVRSMNFRVDGFEKPKTPPPPPTPSPVVPPSICSNDAAQPVDCSSIYNQLYRQNLPFFFPSIRYLRVQSPSVQRIGGPASPAKVKFFHKYLNHGFDAGKNSGEVFLKVEGALPTLAFGAAGKSDQSGGLSSPDIKIAGYSRKGGPVGGRDTGNANSNDHPALTSFSAGTFDPAQFFGGLTSARILGAVKLSDIIAPILGGAASNLSKAPKMLEQAIHQLDGLAKSFTDQAVDGIHQFQLATVDGLPNPVASFLTEQAAAVDAANDAVNASTADTTGMSTGVCEGQLIARIVEYGQALAKVIEQPQGIGQQFLLEELGQLIDAAEAAAVQAAVDTLCNVVVALAPQIRQLQSTLAFFANTLATLPSVEDLVSETLAGIPRTSQNFVEIKRQISDLAPELAAVADIADAATDFANQISKLNATPSGNVLQYIGTRLGNVNAALNDAVIIYQRAGVLGMVSAGANPVANIQTTTISFLANVTSSADAALQTFNDACVVLAGNCASAGADGRELLKELRIVQRVAVQVQGCARLLAPESNLSAVEVQRALGLLRTGQRDILTALAAVQAIARLAGYSSTDAPYAAKVEAAAQALATQVTVIGTLMSATNPYDALRTTILSSALGGPLAASYADIATRAAALRVSITASPPI